MFLTPFLLQTLLLCIRMLCFIPIINKERQNCTIKDVGLRRLLDDVY